MSDNRFKRAVVATTTKPVDQAELQAFSKGADSTPTNQELTLIKIPPYVSKGNDSKVTIRCAPSLEQEIKFVLDNSNARSQQQLLEAILGTQIEALARKIRGQ